MADWQPLLDAVKVACRSGLWSEGVRLARAGAVVGAARGASAWTFRVRSGGSAVAPTVTLHPAEAEWDCDCGGKLDPCAHVAAAAIAVSQAADALFTAAGGGTFVRYEIFVVGDGLGIARYVESADGRRDRLAGSVADAPSLTPSHGDLALDRLLSRRTDVAFAPDRTAGLLRALSAVDHVSLAGMPVRVSREPAFPRARVVDAPDGAVTLVVEREPEVAEVVTAGVVRAGDTLRPMGVTGRYGARWERLPARRTFPPPAFAELVAKLLPELEREIAVRIETRRLPGRAEHARPWLRLEVDTVADGLDVLPTLVYGEPPLARVEGERLVHLRGAVPERDEAAEQRLVHRLRDELHLAVGRRVRLAGADAARLLSALRTFDDGRGGAGRERVAEVPLAPHVRVVGTELELGFRTDDGASASAESVLAAWRQGLGVVPLGDAGFGAIPVGWLARHGHLVTELLDARQAAGGALPRAALPLVGELCEATGQPAPFALERLQGLLADATDVALPADFTGTLRPYQRDGVAWLARLRDAELGAVLADDMGLGKTVQALCALRGRTLVVCPRSVIHNWEREAARFRPALRVALHHGPRRALGPADVTLTTYATLRNDAGELAAVGWDTVILDEAQAIKNPDSRTARAAYALPARFRLSLSGTPIENRLDELWSQVHFTNRGLLGGRRDFAERYEGPMQDGDAAVAARLRSRIRPFLLRRLKRDVAAELPPRTDALLTCELEPAERAVYDAVRAAVRADVVARLAEGGSTLAALEALLRLRQAACHPGLVPGHEAATSSKVEALLDALGDAVADGHKALVFSQWTSFLDRVEPHLADADIAFTRLDGSTRDRAAVVDAFQRADGPPVMLVSLTAGGTGLNLTAADHVFLLDPWWNPAVEEQAADRAHRIGQERPVMVYRMVAKDTVEERVLALAEAKRRLAGAVLEGEGGMAAGITREDVLGLLG
jgi:superfamily II DNA or RNA helicase